ATAARLGQRRPLDRLQGADERQEAVLAGNDAGRAQLERDELVRIPRRNPELVDDRAADMPLGHGSTLADAEAIRLAVGDDRQRRAARIGRQLPAARAGKWLAAQLRGATLRSRDGERA